MFERGAQEGKNEGKGSEFPVRIFSMPEEFRGKEAAFQEEPRKEVVHDLQPLVIPIPIPPEAHTEIQPKKRLSPVLGVMLVVVLMGGTGAGVWWFVRTSTPPQENIPQEPREVPDVVVNPDQKPQEPYPGTDTDSDGLTNVEELLYGTDFRSPDTDGDTFLDGNEVFHRYDPNGPAPSTLLDTGAVRVLERTDIPFTLFYPASWTVTQMPDEKKITFRSLENVSVVLVYEEKDALAHLVDWMKEKGISSRETEETMTKEGYAAQSAQDGRTVYVDLGGWVVSAVYDLGDGMSIEFLQTFKMMMNSVRGNEGIGENTNEVFNASP